jgi:two-component sensor histidine kinase
MKTLVRTPYEATFPGEPDQMAKVRAEIRAYLDGNPALELVEWIVNEFASNAVMHSRSGDGGTFTVCIRPYDEWVWCEVRDMGGLWIEPEPDRRPHGLDIIGDLVGASSWGIKSFSGTRRTVWAKVPRDV